MVSGGHHVARSRYMLGWWDYGVEAVSTLAPACVHSYVLGEEVSSRQPGHCVVI